jgi:hypothetical protein
MSEILVVIFLLSRFAYFQDDPRDFDNIIKVDTHIHLAAAMTARHLLSFIKRKAVQDADVCFSDARCA